ncbi:MAG: type IV secretion protein IcmB [Pseudomonadota bacterium]
MSVVNSVLEGVDEFVYWAGSMFRSAASVYCELETTDDESTLVAKDGSLISFIRVDGARFLVGTEEFAVIHRSLMQGIEAFFGTAGHHMQIVFGCDKDFVVRDIRYALEGSRETARNLQMDVQDMFDAKVAHMSQYTSHEECYLVVWTHGSSMTKAESAAAAKEKVQFNKEHNVPIMKHSQYLFAAIRELRDRHGSFKRSVRLELETAGLDCEILDAHTALRVARMSYDADYTDELWRPRLLGDKISPRAFDNPHPRDISDILYPRIEHQIMPRDAEELNGKWLRIGDRIVAPVHVYLFPKDINTFQRLFARLREADLPWRYSMMMEGGGVRGFGMKSMIAALISFASSNNKLANNAVQALQNYQDMEGGTVVKVSMSFATWAPVGEEKLLRSREQRLARAIEGWGGIEVFDKSGDPFEGVASTLVGFSTKNMGTPAIAPLPDIVYMMPLQRPASSWKEGAVLFRSPDGKLWPYQPGSSKQTTWIDIIFAKPGSGKSVLSNMLNWAICVMPGLKRLPRISVIDIGPSSSGLISLVKDALPPNLKHLANYFRLRMTPEYAVNPFDTQLGYHYPIPQERAFLVNLLTLLTMPMGKTEPYDGMPDICGMVVDEAYRLYSPEKSPKRYSEHQDEKVDAAVRSLGLHTDEITTWWDITDELFKSGMVHEAILAQRFAVPNMNDLTSVVQDQSFRDVYTKPKTATSETIVDAFSRMIQSVLREYPVLTSTTKFDIGDTRIVAIDLDEVAKSGGAAADRRTGIMYMLGQFIGTRNFFFNEENLQECRSLYKTYHKGRVDEIKEDPKRVVFDEFHRTENSPVVRDQVLVYMREGRKWGVQVCLLSQSMNDFDKEMVEFATSIFVLDGGDAAQVKEIGDRFGLSKTARHALESGRVHPPRSGGSTFLAIFSTKKHRNEQLLTNTVGPMELWAFSTTRKDTILRDKLYRAIGSSKARRVLAENYPDGSAMDEIERRELARKSATGMIGEDDDTNIIEGMAEELLKYSHKKDLEEKKRAAALV